MIIDCWVSFYNFIFVLLQLGIAVIHGEQKESESDMVDGRYSPPPAVMTACRTMDVGLDIMPGMSFSVLLYLKSCVGNI